METALYTEMDLTEADGITEVDVIRRAHTLGYELMKFDGWTDADLGPSGMPGPRRADARKNRTKLNEICKSFTDEMYVSIFDCYPSQTFVMEDDEALALLINLGVD